VEELLLLSSLLLQASIVNEPSAATVPTTQQTQFPRQVMFPPATFETAVRYCTNLFLSPTTPRPASSTTVPGPQVTPAATTWWFVVSEQDVYVRIAASPRGWLGFRATADSSDTRPGWLREK
jgi:hypothetical protein